MIKKVKTFVSVVKSIPIMIRSLWWSHNNMDELESFAEGMLVCDECDVDQRTGFHPDNLCDEHTNEFKSFVENGPFN